MPVEEVLVPVEDVLEDLLLVVFEVWDLVNVTNVVRDVGLWNVVLEDFPEDTPMAVLVDLLVLIGSNWLQAPSSRLPKPRGTLVGQFCDVCQLL